MAPLGLLAEFALETYGFVRSCPKKVEKTSCDIAAMLIFDNPSVKYVMVRLCTFFLHPSRGTEKARFSYISPPGVVVGGCLSWTPPRASWEPSGRSWEAFGVAGGGFGGTWDHLGVCLGPLGTTWDMHA